MPLNSLLLLAGLVLVLFGLFRAIFTQYSKGIWFTGSGSILVVISLFILAGFNQTAFYPSVWDLQSSLTIENSSSSHFTLSVMSYVSLAVPFVFLYIFYAWRAMNKKKIDAEEVENDHHAY
jgi:cytochrome d ubiquinol oxidase subunit II